MSWHFLGHKPKKEFEPQYIEHQVNEVQTIKWGDTPNYKATYSDEELLHNSIKTDLEYGFEHERRTPLNLITKLISTNKVEENGRIFIEYKLEVSYSYREYTGDRHGRQLVYQLPYGDYNDYNEEIFNKGFDFVQSILPDAVRRVGCTCCYGSGPDIQTEYNKKTKMMEFYVDFEFRLED